MRHYIENITAFKYEDDSGITAKVSFIYEDHNQRVIVNVKIPHDKEPSLAVIEQRLYDEARKQLKELVAKF